MDQGCLPACLSAVIINWNSGDCMNLLQNVLIYCGPGTCQFSVQQTLRTFKQFLAHAYDVKLIDLPTLQNRNIPWDRNCALFVMPGGRDRPYDACFRDNSIADRIKKALADDKMKYFGICAGAYFGAARVEFEVGRKDYEVCGERPLGLVDSVAKGTLFPGSFKYSDVEAEHETSFHAVDLVVDTLGNDLKALYIGGCYFEETPQDVATIAKYSCNGKAAILAGKSFVLSGVHLEYDAIACLDSVKPVEKLVLSSLIQFEPQRKQLLRDLLAVLELNVKWNEDALPDSFTIFSSKINPGSTENIKFQPISQAGPFDYPHFQRLLPSSIEDLSFWYAPVITSTQTLLLENPQWVEQLPHLSVFLADHQMRGRGRGSNAWISSPACLQFTLVLKHPVAQSYMLPMIQYLMAIAVAETANSLLGGGSGSEVKAQIKWPNDVYLSDRTTKLLGKLSGILVQAVNSLANHRIQNVFVGTGVNVDSDPHLRNVIHLNDFAQSTVSKEAFLAECLGRFEGLNADYRSTGKFPFSRYYANWLHSGQSVNFEGEPVVIEGIDDFGFLKVQNMSGTAHLLEPDGNSFDMMNNLLKRK